MPLPLLRIPDIPLRYIARHMSKIELVKISLCSRRADRALKRCGQKESSYFKIDKYSLNNLEHFQLSLLEAERAEGGVCITHRLQLDVRFFYDDVRIVVSYNGTYVYSICVVCFNKLDQFVGIQKILLMKHTYIPVATTEDEKMNTFWNNRAEGLIFLLKCLNERFKNVVHNLDVCGKLTPDALHSIRTFVDYTSSPEVSLIGVHIDQGVQMPIKEFQYILENVKFRDPSDFGCEFSSCCKVDKNFKFHSTILCYKLFLYSGHWITLQYLLKCKHKKIMVADSKFTNEDIKIYMNQWVAGTIPDVQDVQVDMTEPVEIDHVLSGLQRCRTSCSWLKSRSHLYVLIKGAGDHVAMVRKSKSKCFRMEMLFDPNAVNVENDEEQSGESEETEADKENDGEEDEEDEDMEED